ncbi:MAG: class I SAM-dependent methyltransferase [Chitinophagia bacterium]|nr:class I SAM-dependent methyltransferase [Chitinophagia bacterium]
MSHADSTPDTSQKREEGLNRLVTPTVNILSPYYLFYKYVFRDLKAAIGTHAKGELLDIGCGNKPYQVFFEGKITGYTGCDIVQSSAKQVDIICPATNIPLPDACKDTVFSTQVIEHVADHNGLLAEAYRILRPGGSLIISGPMAWEHHEVPYDFFRFTRHGFEYILQKQGFTDIEAIANGGKWATVGQLFLNSINSSIRKKGLLRLLVKLWYKLFFVKVCTNLFCSWLDDIDTDYESTLNFVVVAKKPLA